MRLWWVADNDRGSVNFLRGKMRFLLVVTGGGEGLGRGESDSLVHLPD